MFDHVPHEVRAAILAHARAMRGVRADQQPNQWADARWTAADELADDLHRLGINDAKVWARALIWRVAN